MSKVTARELKTTAELASQYQIRSIRPAPDQPVEAAAQG